MTVRTSQAPLSNVRDHDGASRVHAISVGDVRASATPRRGWTQRSGPSGVHLFERVSGLNILLDEITVPPTLWSVAPRQVSIALTNRCDLACAHCYAPKSRDELRSEDVTRWIVELDSNGCLGVGFGGGEPTLYPRFAELCQHMAERTRLAITFTTHGHHIEEHLADCLRGSVHFIRVSMDGVEDTYEVIRRRSFSALKNKLPLIKSIAPFGINFVVNGQTLPDLDRAVAIAEDRGASELLLLPQRSVGTSPGIDKRTIHDLQKWVDRYDGSLRLSISESDAQGFPTCDPLSEERGLRAYAHIDATGILKPSSYHATGVPLGAGGLLEALDQLAHDLAEKDA